MRKCASSICSRPPTSGLGTVTWRSKRPGRTSAWSSDSGKFVAAMTMTPSLGLNLQKDCQPVRFLAYLPGEISTSWDQDHCKVVLNRREHDAAKAIENHDDRDTVLTLVGGPLITFCIAKPHQASGQPSHTSFPRGGSSTHPSSSDKTLNSGSVHILLGLATALAVSGIPRIDAKCVTQSSAQADIELTRQARPGAG